MIPHSSLHEVLLQIEVNTAEIAAVLIFLVWVGKHLWREIRPARRRPKKVPKAATPYVYSRTSARGKRRMSDKVGQYTLF